MTRAVPILAAVFAVFAVVAIPVVLAAWSAPTREICVGRSPQLGSDRIGFELIDLLRREAWVTTDWTLDGFAGFSPFPSQPLWFKNEPRIGSAARAKVLRSPGCERAGEFTYMRDFGRDFFHIADVLSVGQRHGDNGEITEATVLKYHRLRFDAGQRVSLLVSPEGERFLHINNPAKASRAAPTLPEGWTLQGRVLDHPRQVDLSGEVRVLRLGDGASYQGPLGAGW